MTDTPHAGAPDPAPDEDDALENALRLAFGGGESAVPASVVSRLLPEGAAPLRLRDDPAEVAPVLLPRGATAEGRYQVVGEIARGGVGVILRGRDVDLGRDVAMKVLRPEHARDPDVIQRFVEEAQVGGQLQHPGIVPVYEMGVGSDRRPWFTMKLIKGRTLASMLHEHREAPVERRRLLAIFESVCHTMAYAHARGVIHRDLKPANVMVGPFGEVLVVDWGMAKVLRQGGAADERRAKRAAAPDTSIVRTVRTGTGSDSQAGAVLGTPRYMAPEQALGEVEHLDERTDVFALGALLCEILTGRPPYDGAEGDVLLAAARARLEGARERLAACGAEAELVALAHACLAPAKEARPKDAGAVAAAVAAHLASVEERARAASVAAAEARGKAAEERRRRRTTLAFSAALVALLSVGGAGCMWVEGNRRARQETAERRVTDALDEAAGLRAKSSGADVRSWDEPLAAARRAAALAAAEDVGAPTRARAAAAVAALEAEQRAAREAHERRERDDRAAAALEAIRLDAVDREDTRGADRRYAEVFASLGIDAGGEAAVAEVAARIAATGDLKPVLTAALYDWWGVRRASRRPDAARLGALVDAVDPDPWAARLRAPATPLDELRTMAREVDVAVRPVQTLRVLVARLGEGGHLEAAYEIAQRIQRAHPGDLWANVAVGSLAGDLTPPRTGEGLRYLTAALSLRPASAQLHHMIGLLYMRHGDLGTGIAMLREAVTLQPTGAFIRADYGNMLVRAGRHEAGIAELEEAVRLEPKTHEHRWNLGLSYWMAGRFADAATAMRAVTDLGPTFFPALPLGKDFERLVALESRLEGVLAGSDVPQDARDALDLAGIAVARGWIVAGAGLFRRGLELDPARAITPLWPYRFNGACAALRAGLGDGKDAGTLDEAGRSAWRRQALAWMRADLADRRVGAARNPRELQDILDWRTDPDLAAVRDPARRAGLPEEEREAFRAWWREIDVLAAEGVTPR